MPKAPPAVQTFTTNSSTETEAVGREISAQLAPPKLLILKGDLGTGKTTLVTGIASALDAADPDEVTSPTFTLVHEYSGVLLGVPVSLLHHDLYRLEGERQLDSLGFEDMLTSDAIVLVEWGEKFNSIRKRADGEIAIVSTGGNSRTITLTLN